MAYTYAGPIESLQVVPAFQVKGDVVVTKRGCTAPSAWIYRRRLGRLPQGHLVNTSSPLRIDASLATERSQRMVAVNMRCWSVYSNTGGSPDRASLGPRRLFSGPWRLALGLDHFEACGLGPLLGLGSPHPVSAGVRDRISRAQKNSVSGALAAGHGWT